MKHFFKTSEARKEGVTRFAYEKRNVSVEKGRNLLQGG